MRPRRSTHHNQFLRALGAVGAALDLVLELRGTRGRAASVGVMTAGCQCQRPELPESLVKRCSTGCGVKILGSLVAGSVPGRCHVSAPSMDFQRTPRLPNKTAGLPGPTWRLQSRAP